MEEILKTIRENLRYYRKEAGLTQERLAAMLGGQKSLVSNYENGHSLPDVLTLCKLADIFAVGVDDILGRNR